MILMAAVIMVAMLFIFLQIMINIGVMRHQSPYMSDNKMRIWYQVTFFGREHINAKQQFTKLINYMHHLQGNYQISFYTF
jgi:hypothetical protein